MKITPFLKWQKAQKPCICKVSEPLKYKKTSPGLYQKPGDDVASCADFDTKRKIKRQPELGAFIIEVDSKEADRTGAMLLLILFLDKKHRFRFPCRFILNSPSGLASLPDSPYDSMIPHKSL